MLEAEVIPENEYLILEDWGIKFKIPEGSSGIKFYKFANIDAYDFSTDRVEALGGLCVDPEVGEAVRLASIGRLPTRSENTTSTAFFIDQPIDGYYYHVQGSQAACAESEYKMQSEDRLMLFEMLSNPIKL